MMENVITLGKMIADEMMTVDHSYAKKVVRT